MRNSGKKVRYAVVGLGYIAQNAVLPAFAHARNSELTALVSDNPTKLKRLSKKYSVPHTYSYEEYCECLESGKVDAVYVALPNHMHRAYTEAAAQAGVHVLCEKPMAVTEEDCQAMIAVAEKNKIKLMVAYRLHFEEANLQAIKLVQSGKLGEPRIFDSVFTMQVKPGNVRLQREKGGGTLYDIGIYCINAARYLFRAEPEEVFGTSENSGDPRFREVEESFFATLRFSRGLAATFACSFGAADVSAYTVVGTKGVLRLDPAYEYASGLQHHLDIGGKKKTVRFPKRDQFAPELIYFSDCIIKDKEPEPSGVEGLQDVRIIRALYRSAAERKPVKLDNTAPRKRPSAVQQISRPPVRKPDLVAAEGPSPD
jgi:predicted dehydrogenase